VLSAELEGGAKCQWCSYAVGRSYVDVNGVSRQWMVAEDSVTGPANEAEHLGIQLRICRQQGADEIFEIFKAVSGTKNFAHGAKNL